MFLSRRAQFGRIRYIDLKTPLRPPAFAFVEFEDPRYSSVVLCCRNVRSCSVPCQVGSFGMSATPSVMCDGRRLAVVSQGVSPGWAPAQHKSAIAPAVVQRLQPRGQCRINRKHHVPAAHDAPCPDVAGTHLRRRATVTVTISTAPACVWSWPRATSRAAAAASAAAAALAAVSAAAAATADLRHPSAAGQDHPPPETPSQLQRLAGLHVVLHCSLPLRRLCSWAATSLWRQVRIALLQKHRASVSALCAADSPLPLTQALQRRLSEVLRHGAHTIALQRQWSQCQRFLRPECTLHCFCVLSVGRMRLHVVVSPWGSGGRHCHHPQQLLSWAHKCFDLPPLCCAGVAPPRMEPGAGMLPCIA